MNPTYREKIKSYQTQPSNSELLPCVNCIMSGCNLQVLPCFLLVAVASKEKLAKLGKKSPRAAPPSQQLSRIFHSGNVSHSSRDPRHMVCEPWGQPGPAVSTCPKGDIEQNPVSHILSISATSDPLPKHCASENGHFSPL